LGAPGIPWEKKTHEERMGFMGGHVEPKMKALFVAYDSSYSTFGCQTCHGRDMELIDFGMPNDIYALSVEDPIEDAMGYDEDVAKFMIEKVVPTMASLMSKTSGKPGGVTCFTCHPRDE
jgi:hypothetical protein